MAMFKNKSVSRLLAVVCCLSIVGAIFTGCGDKKDNNKKEKETTAPAATVSVSEPPAEDVIPEVTVENVTTKYSVPGAVPATEKVDPSYFDDAVFVGDSVSLKLKYYEADADELGDAQFLTEGSLSANQLLMPLDSAGTIHVKYKGVKMNLDDAIEKTGASKMYIMLGMNDIGLGLDFGIENYTKVLDSVTKRCPDITVIVQSVTPCVFPEGYKAINNEKIQEYNKLLIKLCEEKGYYFVDVASVMYGDNGCLKKEYCSDPENMGMHFTNEGCKAWVDYLMTHAV